MMVSFVVVYVLVLYKNYKTLSNLQKLVLQTILETQEKERIRMSRELHDNVGNSLYDLQIQVLKLLNTKLSTEHKEIILQIRTSAAESTTNLKSAIEDLNPFVNESNVWLAKFEKFYLKLNAVGVQVHSIIKGEIFEIGDSSKLNLFRIVQELLNNTKKHAQAKEVYILYVYNKEHFEIDYKDDGVGFDMNELFQINSDFEGYGFHSIKNRVKILNGTHKIISSPNNGTQWIFKFDRNNLI